MHSMPGSAYLCDGQNKINPFYMQKLQTVREQYDRYCAKMRKIADVKNATAVLQWDQETYLPAGGAAFRAGQLATLSTLAHEMFADESLGTLLHGLAGAEGLDAREHKNVLLTLEDYEKNKKYSAAFVAKLSQATSAAYHAWIQARKENDFHLYEASLQQMILLKREEAALLGYKGHPYDALLNDYEKGANTAMLDTIFDNLRGELGTLLQKVLSRPPANEAFMHISYDKDRQWAFGLSLLEKMGFDFNHGRQDISEHPFTTSFSPQDVRVTTRINEHDFANMIWSCIHEGGHALYEQGLDAAQYGLPCGEAASLSIHESQSRLWENCVGRSMAYWQYHYPDLQAAFPQQLKDVPLAAFYKAINRVKPSLIRTEADELTYHFHVMIRYEIEKQVLEGTLNAPDLPAAWNEWYARYLDVKVPDDRQGVLQDIHWSHGSFGYFPTYSLGSLYAAQFFAKATTDIITLEDDVARGNYAVLLQWLRENIHRHGRFYTSEELCRKVTGAGLDAAYFLRYAEKKFDID